MAQTTGTGPLSRFLRFTTQKEPILSSATLIAIALAIVTRFVPLTDDDLQLLALLLLPFAPAVLARLKAWSPASVERTVDRHAAQARQTGYSEGYQVGLRFYQDARPALVSTRSADDGDGR